MAGGVQGERFRHKKTPALWAEVLTAVTMTTVAVNYPFTAQQSTILLLETKGERVVEPRMNSIQLLNEV